MDDHFELPFGKKMRVSLAVQVLSRSVGAAIQTYILEKKLKSDAQETAHFVKKVNEMWDLLNGHTFLSESTQEISKFDDYQEWIKNWRFIDINGRVKETLPFKKALLITLSGFAGLFHDLVHRGHKSISSRRFNQDCVENLFSTLRRDRGGFNSNPEVMKALQVLRFASSTNILHVNATSNCNNTGDNLLLDLGK